MQSINKSSPGSSYKICQSRLQNTVRHDHGHPSPCHLHCLPGHCGSILTGIPASTLTLLLSPLHRTARVCLLNCKSNHTTSCSQPSNGLPSLRIKSKVPCQARRPSVIDQVSNICDNTVLTVNHSTNVRVYYCHFFVLPLHFLALKVLEHSLIC